MNLDYLIIGQGISGSLLAYHLIKYQKKILVIDDPKSNVSTSVAAGIYNPITGRRLVRTWNAHLLFPFLKKVYGELENILNVKSYIHMKTLPILLLIIAKELLSRQASKGRSYSIF